MGIGRKRLSDALKSTLGGKMDIPDMQPALLGAYVNGQKTIPVNGQPDYVWCRISGDTSQQVKAFNQHSGGVAHHFDLPIIIARDQINPDIWKVAGRDVRKYGGWGASGNLPVSSPYLPPHGNDHSFSPQVGMGADPVWVFKRQMMPLLPHPHPTGTMSLAIASDFYFFGGRFNWFSSTGTASLTSHLPTGATNGRFVTVYIDGASGNPALLDGPEINALTPPTDAGEYIQIPTADQGVAVAAVFLLTGTQRIGWGEIFDLRWPHTPVPGSGTASAIYDEAQPIGQYLHLNFVRGINAQASGSFAEVSVDQGFSPTWSALHTFQGTVLFETLVGMGGDLRITGSVFSGEGSFHTPGWLQTRDRAAPATPPASEGRWYQQSGSAYFMNDAGAISELSDSASASPSVYEIRLQSDVNWGTMPDSTNQRFFALPGGFIPQTSNDAPPHIVSRGGTIVRVVAYAYQILGATAGSNEPVGMDIGVNGVYTDLGDLDLSTSTPGSTPATVVYTSQISISQGDLINARIRPPASFATNPTFIFFALIALVEDGGG